MEIGTGAVRAAVRSLTTVEAFVELEVDELSKAGRAEFALVRPLTRVQPLVGLKVTSAAESFMAHLAFMRLLSCVNQVVFLQMCQLSEVLVAGLTPKGTLATVYSQMDLEVGQLPKDLSTDVALIPYLSVLPGERVRQGLVADDLPSSFDFPEVHRVLSIVLSSRGRFGGEAV